MGKLVAACKSAKFSITGPNTPRRSSMKTIIASVGGRAPSHCPASDCLAITERRGKISRRLAQQDLVGLTKLTVLALQSLHLLGHLRRNAGPRTAINLGSLAPFVQRVRRAPDLGCYRNNRLPARSVLALIVQHKAHRPLAYFRGKTCSLFCSLCSILLRSWSLRQTRSGSLIPVPRLDIGKAIACISASRATFS